MDSSNRIRQLREKLDKERNAERHRVLARALGSIFVSAIEAGSPILEKGDGRGALPYFELAAVAMPQSAWPHLSMASCHAARRDRKSAMRELILARDAGASSTDVAEFVKGDPKLAPFGDSPEYQKLLGDSRP